MVRCAPLAELAAKGSLVVPLQPACFEVGQQLPFPFRLPWRQAPRFVLERLLGGLYRFLQLR